MTAAAMQNEKERLLWEAKAAVKDALDFCGREALVDYLDGPVRAELFAGHVLVEHYDSLKRKYDILKSSHTLQHDAVMRTTYAG